MLEGKRHVKLFDSEVPGLAVRKMVSGVTTFIVEQRPPGSSVEKQITIGRAAHYTVDQARIEGRKLLAELSSNDYLAIASLKSSTPTFADALESYAKLELPERSKATSNVWMVFKYFIQCRYAGFPLPQH